MIASCLGGSANCGIAAREARRLLRRLLSSAGTGAARFPHELRRGSQQRPERADQPVVFDPPPVVFGLEHPGRPDRFGDRQSLRRRALQPFEASRRSPGRWIFPLIMSRPPQASCPFRRREHVRCRDRRIGWSFQPAAPIEAGKRDASRFASLLTTPTRPQAAGKGIATKRSPEAVWTRISTAFLPSCLAAAMSDFTWAGSDTGLPATSRITSPSARPLSAAAPFGSTLTMTTPLSPAPDTCLAGAARPRAPAWTRSGPRWPRRLSRSPSRRA